MEVEEQGERGEITTLDKNISSQILITFSSITFAAAVYLFLSVRKMFLKWVHQKHFLGRARTAGQDRFKPELNSEFQCRQFTNFLIWTWDAHQFVDPSPCAFTYILVCKFPWMGLYRLISLISKYSIRNYKRKLRVLIHVNLKLVFQSNHEHRGQSGVD